MLLAVSKKKKKENIGKLQYSTGVFENHTHGLILLLQFYYC